MWISDEHKENFNDWTWAVASGGSSDMWIAGNRDDTGTEILVNLSLAREIEIDDEVVEVQRLCIHWSADEVDTVIWVPEHQIEKIRERLLV